MLRLLLVSTDIELVSGGDAIRAVKQLRGFIGAQQISAVLSGFRCEEKQFFFDKMAELAAIVAVMPVTYSTDGQGEEATAWLHYFAGGCANWYITEKDKGSAGDTPEDFQAQAFGLADLFGDGGELGYISIREIIEAGGELDFYWTPRTLREIKEAK